MDVGQFWAKTADYHFGEHNSDAIGVVMEGIEPGTPVDLHEVRKVLNRQKKMSCTLNQTGEYDFDVCRVLSVTGTGRRQARPLSL